MDCCYGRVHNHAIWNLLSKLPVHLYKDIQGSWDLERPKYSEDCFDSCCLTDQPNGGLMLYANQILCVNWKRRMIRRLNLGCFILITSRSSTSRVVPLTKYFCLHIGQANCILIVSESSVMVEGGELILCWLKWEST